MTAYGEKAVHLLTTHGLEAEESWPNNGYSHDRENRLLMMNGHSSDRGGFLVLSEKVREG